MKEIPLTRGLVAQVDDRDYDVLMRLAPWHATKDKRKRTFYAVHSYSDGGENKMLFMHHVIKGRKYGDRELDHIDGNGLNNQRSNLRWGTRTQNRANSAKYRSGTNRFKGVSLFKQTGKYRARIGEAGRHLGFFVLEEDAARAYDRAAIEMYGEFARLNFPQVERNQ